MKLITILLALVCVSAYVGSAQAECCRRSMSLLYTVASGTCEDSGGYLTRGSTCLVIICADGKRQVGSYCGRQSCNIFGCNCGGGCLKGNWEKSFIANNKRQKVIVLEAGSTS